MAGAALIGNRCLRVVPLGRFPTGDAVAADAVQAGGNVATRLARSGIAIMATGTVGATVEQAVIGLGAQPGAGGLVAAFAGGLAAVDGSSRPTRGTKTGTHVACRTLCGH